MRICQKEQTIRQKSIRIPGSNRRPQPEWGICIQNKKSIPYFRYALRFTCIYFVSMFHFFKLPNLTILSVVLCMGMYTCSVQAQDTLVLRSGKTEIIQSIRYNDTQVVYKKYFNVSGPLYFVSMHTVNSIRFANGSVFKNEKAPPIIDKKNKKPGKYREYSNHITINTYDLLYNTITIQYMLAKTSENLSIRIPISLGAHAIQPNPIPPYHKASDRMGYYNSNKLFSTGCDVLFFPFNRDVRLRFFIGPSIEYGRFRYMASMNNYIYGPINTSHYKAALLHYGFLFQNTKHIHVSFGLSVGASNHVVKRFHTDGFNTNSVTNVTFRLQCNIGYKFM